MPENKTSERGKRKERQGTVVSVSGAKSVVVEVETRKRHALYGKTVRERRRFHAHDEASDARMGDVVRIVETRPLSKIKRWRVLEVQRRAVVA